QRPARTMDKLAARIGREVRPVSEQLDEPGRRRAASEIYLLISVPLHVPARTVTQVREYRVNAGLRLRLARFDLGLTALLRHRVKLVNLHDSERLAACGNPILNWNKPPDIIGTH